LLAKCDPKIFIPTSDMIINSLVYQCQLEYLLKLGLIWDKTNSIIANDAGWCTRIQLLLQQFKNMVGPLEIKKILVLLSAFEIYMHDVQR